MSMSPGPKNPGAPRRPLTVKGGFSLSQILSKGEPFIWQAGAACAVVIFMVLLLLAVVLFEGAGFFWPRQMPRLQLADGGVLQGPVRGKEIYRPRDEAGKILREVPRRLIMAGNRDVTGQDFVWVDESEVVAESFPRDLLFVERQEWGPLVGTLVQFKTAQGVVPAQAPDFWSQFEKARKAARARFRQARKLERDDMGHLNHIIRSAELQLRALELEAGQAARQAPPEKVKALKKSIEVVQLEYVELKKRLTLLEEKGMADVALFSVQQNETVELTMDQLVRVVRGNDMGPLGRLGIYVARVWEFIWGEPRESNTEGGVFPAIFGTVMMCLIMSVVVVPFGVVAALYLREYAKQGVLVSAVRIAVNNLAGVPSIVFGVFGLGFFVYGVGGSIDRWFFPEALPTPTFGTGGILWASLTLALLTVPVVIVATEEALAFVPRGIRDGSLACGATKWQTIQRVVLPSAAPGILTGVILALARGAGEVAPLMITGVVKLAPGLPLDGYFPFFHPERKFMHLGFHIYDVGFQSPNVEAAQPMVYTTTLLLIAVVVGLNLVAMYIRNHLKKKYRSSSIG